MSAIFEGLIRQFFKPRPVWEFGVVGESNKPARRNRKTGAVQFVLWRAGDRQGDYLYAEDYWINYDSSWWPDFKPNTSGMVTPPPQTCRCRSYNRPDLGGDRPEVLLEKPDFIGGQVRTIGVDACIADAIRMLWSHGIVTTGCCCGHNRRNPSIVIETTEDAARVARLLAENDGRPWDVEQWRLINTSTGPPVR
jgi:hypothetical protein